MPSRTRCRAARPSKRPAASRRNARCQRRRSRSPRRGAQILRSPGAGLREVLLTRSVDHRGAAERRRSPSARAPAWNAASRRRRVDAPRRALPSASSASARASSGRRPCGPPSRRRDRSPLARTAARAAPNGHHAAIHAGREPRVERDLRLAAARRARSMRKSRKPSHRLLHLVHVAIAEEDPRRTCVSRTSTRDGSGAGNADGRASASRIDGLRSIIDVLHRPFARRRALVAPDARRTGRVRAASRRRRGRVGRAEVSSGHANLAIELCVVRAPAHAVVRHRGARNRSGRGAHRSLRPPRPPAPATDPTAAPATAPLTAAASTRTAFDFAFDLVLSMPALVASAKPRPILRRRRRSPADARHPLRPRAGIGARVFERAAPLPRAAARGTAVASQARMTLQLTFRDFPPTDAVRAYVEKRASKLLARAEGATATRVTLSAPHHQSSSRARVQGRHRPRPAAPRRSSCRRATARPGTPISTPRSTTPSTTPSSELRDLARARRDDAEARGRVIARASSRRRDALVPFA